VNRDLEGKNEMKTRRQIGRIAQRLAVKTGLDASPMVQFAALRSTIASFDIGSADVWQVSPVPVGKNGDRLLRQIVLNTAFPRRPETSLLLIIAPFYLISTLITMLDTNHKGRSTTLFKAFLGALLVGGTVLTANTAQAVGWEPTPPIGPATGFKCLLNDAECFTTSVTLGDKEVKLISRTTLVADNDVVEFTLDPTDTNTPYNLSLDFNPNRNNILNDIGNLRYRIAITDPTRFFDQVKLANQGDITNGKYTITKTFWNSDYTVQVIADTLTNPVTPDGISLARLNLQTLYVQDEWNVQPDANGSINSLQNSFGQTTHVPGPLPLVGIGAAFGLSRRIRSRIKGARLA
jgi:hypothetical protein